MGRGMGEHGGKPPYPDTRMAERRGLSVRHAPPTVPSSSHPALGQRANATGYHGAAPHTPILGWQNGGAFQFGTRRRQFPLPATSRPAKGQRALGYHGAAPHTPTLEWQNGGAFQFSTRRRKPACQTAHALPLRRKAALEWMNGGICQCHPIDRKAGLAISARATKNHCTREHITPEWQDFKTYRFCTRRQKSFFQKIQALPAPALRTHSLPALFYH